MPPEGNPEGLWLILLIMKHHIRVNFEFLNLTIIETQNNIYQCSLIWCNQNNPRNQEFSFGNLEMPHATELGVDESETTWHCYIYWKKSCYCNMQISSSYRFWDMEGLRSSCHSVDNLKDETEYLKGKYTLLGGKEEKARLRWNFSHITAVCQHICSILIFKFM